MINTFRFVSVMKDTPKAHHLTFGEPGSLGKVYLCRFKTAGFAGWTLGG